MKFSARKITTLSTLILFISSWTFAEEMRLKVRTTPYYGLKILQDGKILKEYPASARVKNETFSFPESNSTSTGNLEVCFKSSSSSKTPNAANLGLVVVEVMDPTKHKYVQTDRFIAPTGSEFKPDTETCLNRTQLGRKNKTEESGINKEANASLEAPLQETTVETTKSPNTSMGSFPAEFNESKVDVTGRPGAAELLAAEDATLEVFKPMMKCAMENKSLSEDEAKKKCACPHKKVFARKYAAVDKLVKEDPKLATAKIAVLRSSTERIIVDVPNMQKERKENEKCP